MRLRRPRRKVGDLFFFLVVQFVLKAFTLSFTADSRRANKKR